MLGEPVKDAQIRAYINQLYGGLVVKFGISVNDRLHDTLTLAFRRVTHHKVEQGPKCRFLTVGSRKICRAVGHGKIAIHVKSTALHHLLALWIKTRRKQYDLKLNIFVVHVISIVEYIHKVVFIVDRRGIPAGQTLLEVFI